MTPREYVAALEDVEARLERVRALYEQWFQGFERIEPRVQRKDMERHLYALRKVRAPTTALRFRFNNLWQRFITMQSYWGRVARQIEEGTYRRDLLKLRRKRLRRREAAEHASREQDAAQPVVQVEASLDDLDAEIDAALSAVKAWDGVEATHDTDPAPPPVSSPVAVPPPPPMPKPPRGTGAAPPPPPSPRARPAMATFGRPRDPLTGRIASVPSVQVASSSEAHSKARPPSSPRAPSASTPRPVRSVPSRGGLPDEQRLREVHRRLVEERRRRGLDAVSYERFSRSVQRMLPKLQQRAKGRSIDFDVVVREGKVGLKPKIK